MGVRFDNLARACFLLEQTKLPMAGKKDFPKPSY